MKQIFSLRLTLNFLLLIFVAASYLFLVQPIYASTLYVSPGSAKAAKGGNISVQVRLNTAGEAVNAVSVYMSYPVDKLEVTGISFGSSAFGIQAENVYGGGGLKFSRGSINPVSGNVNTGTITFRAKALGKASISFSGGSAAPRAADSSDSLNLGGSSGATITIVESLPPEETQGPKISEVKVDKVATDSASISWKTDEKSDSSVEFGLEKDRYFLNQTTKEMVTEHKLIVKSDLFIPGSIYHFRIKSKNSNGDESASSDSSFQLTGFSLKIKLVDANGNPLTNTQVTLFSDPVQATTDQNGEVIFENVIPGKHVVVIKTAFGEKTQEIEIKNSQPDQGQVLSITVDKNDLSKSLTTSNQGVTSFKAFFSNPLMLASGLVLLIVILIILSFRFFSLRRHKKNNVTHVTMTHNHKETNTLNSDGL